MSGKPSHERHKALTRTAQTLQADAKQVALESEVSALEDKVTAQTLQAAAKQAALEEKVTASEGKVSAYEEKVSALEGKVSALEEKVSASEGKVTALNVQLATVTKVCQKLVDALQKSTWKGVGATELKEIEAAALHM